VACAAPLPDLEIVGQVDQGDDLGAIIGKCDAVIEFSFHNVTSGVAALCAKHRKALVIGTTGHTETEKSEIGNRKSEIPMVWASNYSTGVNTLFWLTRRAAVPRSRFDLEVIEMHHRLKKDAPSGTATTLLEILADVRPLKEALRHGRRASASAHERRDRDPCHPRRRRGGNHHTSSLLPRRARGVDLPRAAGTLLPMALSVPRSGS
jgi:4-hydroxy-tetrahydrodipicolinate reductase